MHYTIHHIPYTIYHIPYTIHNIPYTIHTIECSNQRLHMIHFLPPYTIADEEQKGPLGFSPIGGYRLYASTPSDIVQNLRCDSKPYAKEHIHAP
ncbi:hypothetical protein EON63_11565 [archaeon]|nr:MAG: hypothetical protein EON63_11565 [archaeon]